MPSGHRVIQKVGIGRERIHGVIWGDGSSPMTFFVYLILVRGVLTCDLS